MSGVSASNSVNEATKSGQVSFCILRRQDDVVKFSFTVSLNPPPPAVAPINRVKALPPK